MTRQRVRTLIERLNDLFRATLGPPLKALHTPVDQWLATLPMGFAMACALGLYFVAVVWVWTLKKEFVFRGAPDRKSWRDLRVWATLVVIPYVFVYLLLGR